MNISIIENGGFRYFIDLRSDGRSLVIESTLGGTAIPISKINAICVCVVDSLEKARNIYERLEEYKVNNCVVVVADVEDLPFREKIFNLICDHGTLINSAGFQKYIKEICRVADKETDYYVSYEGGKKSIFFKHNNVKKLINELTRKYDFEKKMNIFHLPSLLNIQEIRTFDFVEKPNFFKKLWMVKLVRTSHNYGCLLKKKSVDASHNTCNSIFDQFRIKLNAEKNIKVTKVNVVRVGTGGSIIADFGKVIARIPQTEDGKIRCNNNYHALLSLQNRQIGIGVPEPMGVYEISGNTLYIESKITGRSLDEKPLSKKGTNEISRQALVILNSLGRFDKSFIGEEEFSVTVKKDFEQVLRFIKKNDIKPINIAYDYIREKVLNEKIPMVMNHGDFKPSNFIIKGLSKKRIVGIIDWDKSRMSGLPLIDILYLLARQNKPYGVEYLSEIWSLAKNFTEYDEIIKYMKLFNIEAKFANILALCGIIKQIADLCLSTTINDEWYRRKKMICWSEGWYHKVILRFLLPVCDDFINSRTRN